MRAEQPVQEIFVPEPYNRTLDIRDTSASGCLVQHWRAGISIENLEEWVAAVRRAAEKLAAAGEAIEEALQMLRNLPELKVAAKLEGADKTTA